MEDKHLYEQKTALKVFEFIIGFILTLFFVWSAFMSLLNRGFLIVLMIGIGCVISAISSKHHYYLIGAGIGLLTVFLGVLIIIGSCNNGY